MDRKELLYRRWNYFWKNCKLGYQLADVVRPLSRVQVDGALPIVPVSGLLPGGIQ